MIDSNSCAQIECLLNKSNKRDILQYKIIMEQKRGTEKIKLAGAEKAFYSACFKKYSKQDPVSGGSVSALET